MKELLSRFPADSRLRIALCEDDRQEREHLLTILRSSNIPVQVWEFEEGGAFLKGYKPGAFDLILMDIYMNGISGVEAMRAVRKEEPSLPAAFITTSQDHALEAYRMHVDRYIEKPVAREEVVQILRSAAAKKEHFPKIALRPQKDPLWIPIHKLLYVEQLAHYLHLHLLDGEVVKVKGKLDDLLPQLEGLPLFRCHKSFLVNLAFVTGIDRELMVFHMKDGSNVYIRREAFPVAKQAWETWLFAASREEGRTDGAI